jgi:glycosyltransferase involved in cell wall biosynthesis
MSEPELISVIVPAYNSESTIIETLDSIANQTYKNIELIVCSDKSTDGTDKIVQNWINERPRREEAILPRLISQSSNIGLTRNLNAALKLSSGAWIKIIAADDVLMPECIETLHKECKDKQADIAFGNIIRFKTRANGERETFVDQDKGTIARNFSLEPQGFFKELVKKCFLQAPAAMISKQLLLETKGFDEKYRLMEDWPFWLKCCEMGKKFSYIDKDVVWYRIHSNSISTIKYLGIKSSILNQISIDRINFDYQYRRKHIENTLEVINIINLYLASRFNKTWIGGTYLYYIMRMTNPLSLIRIFNNIMIKLNK